MAIKLSDIKNEIKKSGTSKGKFLFFKEGVKTRVRFLNDLEEGMEVPFHDSFQMGINVPCQEVFGRTCEYCDMEELRTRNMYIWSVYDYEAKEVKLLMVAVNQCSPVPGLTANYEQYGTLTDRDYVIQQIGSGQGKSFSVIGLDKSKFRNTKAKPLSESAILKYLDKAYPADNNEDMDEDEEERPRRNKASRTKGTKGGEKKKPPMNEPEDDGDDWEDLAEDEEEGMGYEEMSAVELYKLCKEKGIECKPRKAKEYYIDLLDSEEENDEDDWGEDEDEWE